MTDLVVDARGLRKVYRDRRNRITAVDGLDLAIPRGVVHGFLGPNGSGKTTTIRMLLGLARPDAGEIRLFGERVPDPTGQVMRRVGALVEEPRFVPDLTGPRNLELLASLGGIDHARVGAVLEQVGLDDVRKERYRGYSFGMRQRLGVAAALLKQPDLVVLDEPSHGLDPAGIIDMRELIRRLGADGVTVLLSSHILAEVQQVCASVSIIGEGRLMADGAVAELLGESVARTRIEVADTDAARAHLLSAGYRVSTDDDALLVEGHEHPEQITRLLAEHGIYLSGIGAVRPDLESFFLSLTGHRPAPIDPAERVADETAERVELPHRHAEEDAS